MTPTGSPPADWRAENLKQLRQVWKDLHPDSDEEGVTRTFRGQVLTAEQAGDVFERWLLEAFRLSGMAGHYRFEVPLRGSGNVREEIDGLLVDGWQAFLIEAKFWTGRVDFGPIALLHTLLDTRPVRTLGLFFSAFGYTSPALESAWMLRPLRVLLFEKDDLDWSLSQRPFRGCMAEMIRRKWTLAVMYGQPDMRLTTPLSLFNE